MSSVIRQASGRPSKRKITVYLAWTIASDSRLCLVARRMQTRHACHGTSTVLLMTTMDRIRSLKICSTTRSSTTCQKPRLQRRIVMSLMRWSSWSMATSGIKVWGTLPPWLFRNWVITINSVVKLWLLLVLLHFMRARPFHQSCRKRSISR